MLKKIVTFEGAFDKRHTDPSKDYGIRDVRIRFVLLGEKGATQFICSTGWYLPHLTHIKYRKPMGYDVGYHSYVPLFEGQNQMDKCDILICKSGGCFYDGSTLQADELLEKLIKEGSKAVWERLRAVYKERFSVLNIDEINKFKGAKQC